MPLVGFSTNANLTKLEEDIQVSVFLLTNFLFSNFLKKSITLKNLLRCLIIILDFPIFSFISIHFCLTYLKCYYWVQFLIVALSYLWSLSLLSSVIFLTLMSSALSYFVLHPSLQGFPFFNF